MEGIPPCSCVGRLSVLEERLAGLTRSVDKAEQEIKEKVLHGNALREEMRVMLSDIRGAFVSRIELESSRLVERTSRAAAVLVPTVIAIVGLAVALVALYMAIKPQVWVR